LTKEWQRWQDEWKRGKDLMEQRWEGEMLTEEKQYMWRRRATKTKTKTKEREREKK
jgi:hypothetical protein